ncbi:hypothetical protein PG999_003838 [Apiospora kogelbergensis]|uniref:Uncharacterized protein n=1 Tax=Apiospora kogelbergensis TaxID=1337665 RepID=A0AAW0R4L7_9PEZI
MPRSSLPARLSPRAFRAARPFPTRAVRQHRQISRVGLRQSKSPGNELDTSVTSSAAYKWQDLPPPFPPFRPQKHIDISSTPALLWQSTLLPRRPQNTLPLTGFTVEKLRYLQQQQEAIAAATADAAATNLDYPMIQSFPWKQKKTINTPRNPGVGKETLPNTDADTKAAAATKAEGWKDTYLPIFKLCIPDHPITFSCEPGYLREPAVPGDEAPTPVRVWTYDWEFERSITLSEREQNEKKRLEAEKIEKAE